MAKKNTRLNYLDWLTIMAMLGHLISDEIEMSDNARLWLKREIAPILEKAMGGMVAEQKEVIASLFDDGVVN